MRKLIEHRNFKFIKANNIKNLKALAIRSFAKYQAKSKQSTGDPIQEKLLYSDAVIINDDNEFEVVDHSASIDFIPVDAL